MFSINYVLFLLLWCFQGWRWNVFWMLLDLFYLMFFLQADTYMPSCINTYRIIYIYNSQFSSVMLLKFLKTLGIKDSDSLFTECILYLIKHNNKTNKQILHHRENILLQLLTKKIIIKFLKTCFLCCTFSHINSN